MDSWSASVRGASVRRSSVCIEHRAQVGLVGQGEARRQPGTDGMVRRHDGDGLVDVVAVAGVWPIPPRQVSRRVVEPPADDLGEAGQAGHEQMLWWSATTGTPAAGALQPSTARSGGSTISRDPAPDPQSRHVVEDDHVGAEVVRVQALAGLGVIDPLDRHTRQLEEMIERRLIETVAAGDHERGEPAAACSRGGSATRSGWRGGTLRGGARAGVDRPLGRRPCASAAKRLAGELVRRGWDGVVELGAIGPDSRRGRRFGSFGERSVICFPPTAIVNERYIHIGAGTMIGPAGQPVGRHGARPAVPLGPGGQHRRPVPHRPWERHRRAPVHRGR